MITRRFDTAARAATERCSTRQAPTTEAAVLRAAGGGQLGRAGSSLLQLQRQYGNRYVQRVVGQARQPSPPAPEPVIQTKLVLGAADDRYEREADRLARHVLSDTAQRQRDQEDQTAAGRLPPVRRLHRPADDRVAAPVERLVQQARGGGQALPSALRRRMEQALGADLSGVRIHADTQADQLNRSLQARAFTTGRDIFFSRGAYDPGSTEGQRLIAHELTHVLQQTAMPVHGSQRGTEQGRIGETCTIGDQLVVQRVKDFASSGVSRGSGLTPSKTDLQWGTWHIHVIQDDEQLGLIEKVFLTFEDLKTSGFSAHLMFDRDGKLQQTGLSQHGDPAMIQWGRDTIQQFLALCQDVSAAEIDQRRKAKAEEEQRTAQKLAALPPLKDPTQHEYTGKQAGLFGSSSSVSEEKAAEMLAKAGITQSNKDYNSIKAKIKSASPKEQWPSYIKQYYDQVYGPALAQVSAQVSDVVQEQTAAQQGPVPEKGPEPTAVGNLVKNELARQGPGGTIGPALLRYGVPAALVFLIIGIVLSYFLS